MNAGISGTQVHSVFINLLHKNIDKKIILDVTGLSESELKKLEI